MVAETKLVQTEIGLIPKDWDIVNLGQNCVLKARIGWQGLTTAEYLPSGDYYLVTGTDFKNGYIDWDNCVFVEKNRYDQDRNIQLKENDVLITKDGTIGKVAFINKLKGKTTLNSGVFVLRSKYEKIDNQFIYYILMSFYFDDFLNKITAGSTITHLYQKDFVHFNFILPPLSEQQAIAEALSNADAWIESLEKLIAKKRLLKQGAMQELLTPKEDWEVKKLGEVCEIFGRIGFRGYTVKDIVQENNGAITLGPSNMRDGKITDTKFTYISWDKYFESPEIMLENGDIVLVKTASVGRIALIKNLDTPMTINPQLVVLKKIKLNAVYLNYFMQFEDFQNQIKSKLGGGVLSTLTQEEIKRFEIYIPKTKEEPEQIAAILSDMDAELEAIEKQLEKARQIKQGMMQELLTGRIRLV